MAKKKKKRKKDKKSKKNGKPTQAELADRYELYLASVQAPDVDARFFNKVYRRSFDRPPKVFREDFCGTAAVCCEWVARKKDRTAYGVDLDPEPLSWGAENNLGRLKNGQRERVQLVQGDVRTADTPPADIVAAQNFSYCVFKQRDELRRYFERVRTSMASEGVFILDLFGGYESLEDNREEVTEYDGFDYVWEQHEYDPINAHGIYKIHFRFDDGSELSDAFIYDWRLWTIPEVCELLREAGFAEADVYWEGTDEKTGEGNGVYKPQKKGECDPAWNAYIVGVKR